METNDLPSIQLKIPPDQEKPLIPDEKMLSYYEEVIENLRSDRAEASEMYLNFAEMIVNGGDGSSASKEALVNLLKIKTETNDRMIKVLDQWARIKTRDNMFPKYLAVQQNNRIDQKPQATRKMIEMLNQMESVDVSE